MNQQHLILGGARSGKSRFAESVVKAQSQQTLDNHSDKQGSNKQHFQKIYVATAAALDDEMQQRINRHKDDRDDSWKLIEEPLDLASVIQQAKSTDCLLIECLTLWLSNCLHNDCWQEQKAALFSALKTSNAMITMVSNEVGQGIVPMNALSRQFVDESGWLHQELACVCDKVSFVTAGIPQTLKDTLSQNTL